MGTGSAYLILFPRRSSQWSATAFPHTNQTYDISSNSNSRKLEKWRMFGATIVLPGRDPN
jgi:hypothetical protein